MNELMLTHHELNCNNLNAEGNSCPQGRFMFRRNNSCNAVAIHCVFSVKDNTHVLDFLFYAVAVSPLVVPFAPSAFGSRNSTVEPMVILIYLISELLTITEPFIDITLLI